MSCAFRRPEQKATSMKIPFLSSGGASMSLSKRFAFSFAAILAMLILVGGVSQVLMSTISGRMKGIVEVNNRQMALANTMIDQVNDMAITLRTLTLLTEVKEVDKQVKLLEQATDSYLRTEKELAQLLNSGGGAMERELLKKIEAVRATTLPLIAKAAKLGSDGATPEATIVLMREVRPVEHEWRTLVGQLISLETQLNASAYAEARKTESISSVVLVAVGAFALALGGLLAFRLSRSVLKPVSEAIRVTERIAEGDLSTPVDASRSDELGRLLAAVAGMQDRLRNLVGDIRNSAESISSASSEIATGNHDLSHRTEQQAASLQKTASSMEQLTGTVRHNADSARQADQLAVSASEIAARGGVVVDQVVTTMADISASSKKIADIIGVIDGIAFQTNILALNAAVEAARAGEQGRGFAVVAGEVRSLAQRSAEAAKEIKALISASGERVDSGAKLVTDAGSTMREIVASIQRVTDIMSEISASTSEQSNGIGHVSSEVHQLDQMTQQNAALVEQSAAATESLKDQASRLAQAVRAFRLRGEALAA
jgi:methyl-accepting chemotaxis protein